VFCFDSSQSLDRNISI